MTTETSSLIELSEIHESKIYSGRRVTPQMDRLLDGVIVEVIYPSGHYDLVNHADPSQETWPTHAPSFEWGYGGSGPRQLAFELLYDVTNNIKLAERLSSPFQGAFTAHLDPVVPWQILESDIVEWIVTRELPTYEHMRSWPEISNNVQDQTQRTNKSS